MIAVVLIIAVAIGTAILIASMFITSYLGGGVEFGDIRTVLAKAVPLLLVIYVLDLFIPYGFWISLLVWLIGLKVLFRLDNWEWWTLIVINWVLNRLLGFLLIAAFLRL
jgi:hypothetical protein